jgi:hypothetical protein
MALTRSDAPEPVRPKQTVDIPRLGEVVFRGLSLTDVWRITEAHKGAAALDHLLAATAVDGQDGAPLWSAEGWASLSLRDSEAYMVALKAMQRLNGLDAEANAGN